MLVRWCVLWWLNRPIVALNCLLQTEQVNAENDDSDDDPLGWALRILRFRSASLIMVNIYFLFSPLKQREVTNFAKGGIASLCKIVYFPHRIFGIFLFEIMILPYEFLKHFRKLAS